MENVKKKIEKVLTKFIKITDSASNHSKKNTNDLHDIGHILSNESSINETHTSTFDFNIYIKMFIHELRTPISTISMGLELLQNETLSNSGREIIADLKKNVSFIENIFSNFAVFNKGHIELNTFKPFSLNKLIKRVIGLLQYYIQTNDISITYHIQSDVYDWVYGDEHNIKHCIINLLKNAIKYRNISRPAIISINLSKNDKPTTEPHPPSQPPQTNTMKLLKTTRSVIFKRKQIISISIDDNNDHLLPNIKEHLFESFNSTSGSGLGLFICKNIIDLHNGHIDHYFIQPIGNKFEMTFPFELCEDGNLQILNNTNDSINIRITKLISEKKTEVISEKNDNITGPNVFLIDDSLFNRKMLYKILKTMNIYGQIYSASDGKDAVDKISSGTYIVNIIFLDKYMPDMDGLAVAKELRKNAYNQLIIGITGDDDNLEVFLENGADYVLIKPLDIKKILMINDFVKKYGTNRYENKTVKNTNGTLEWE